MKITHIQPNCIYLALIYRFLGTLWLKIKRAIPPELILWNNIAISQKKRIKKRLIIILIFILMLGVFGVAAWIIRYQRTAVSNSTNLKECYYMDPIEMDNRRAEGDLKCYCLRNNYFEDEESHDYREEC